MAGTLYVIKTGCTSLAKYRVISFDKIPSTQTHAHNMIADGVAADHVAIVAEAQSAGRGRYRRTWVSRPGNLYVSFIYGCPERDPRISYAVAVAVAETILSFGILPTIKWPNDILVNGAKVCGILIEYSGRFVIVGIGVNIRHAPVVEKYATTCLADWADVSKIEFMNRLMKNLDKWMAADFVDVRARWMELAAGLNRVVKYRGGDVELMGINERGALVLRRGDEYLLAYGDEITF